MNGNDKKPKQLTSILELTPPEEVTPGQLEILAEPTPADQGQHIVQEYDQGYALLVVKKVPSEATGKPSWRNEGQILCVTDHFLLTGMNESDQERFSMAYTIGDPVLRGGLGRRPRMYAYSGILVDTEKDGAGIAIWREIYEKYLRASSCVNLTAIVELTFRDQYRKGFVTTCNMLYSANNPQRAGLSFVMFVVGTNRAES